MANGLITQELDESLIRVESFVFGSRAAHGE